jgi:phenylacetate-CoA ligase
MIVNETLLVEIVRPGTGDPVAADEVGEVVVTSFNPDYPMIRLATGDLSAALTSEASGQRGHSIDARAGHSPEPGSSARAVLVGKSPCGRSNMRIKGWMGRADQTTKVKGMFVHPAQVAEVGKRHPQLGRLRLIVAREGEQDVMVLKAECGAPASELQGEVAATLQSVTKLRGTVELVAPGSLPNDGKIIADERPIG